MFGVKLAAKAVDIMCLPIYLIAVASDSASNLRGLIGDSSYIKGYNSGYKQAIRDLND